MTVNIKLASAIFLAVLGLAACGAHSAVLTAPAPAHSSATTASITPPTPSPVSTTASLSSKCTTGFVDTATSANDFLSFAQSEKGGAFPSEDAQSGDVQGGYSLTLTNSSPATAEVSYYAVVFYSDGQEVGDDDQSLPNVVYIPPGQSWTFNNPTTAMNVSEEGAVNTIDTCALVSRTSP